MTHEKTSVGEKDISLCRGTDKFPFSTLCVSTISAVSDLADLTTLLSLRFSWAIFQTITWFIKFSLSLSLLIHSNNRAKRGRQSPNKRCQLTSLVTSTKLTLGEKLVECGAATHQRTAHIIKFCAGPF